MIYFYLMFISGHEHYLRLKVLRRYFQYISLGQPVCFALIKDGGKNHESAYGELVLVAIELVTTEIAVGDDNFLPLLDFEAMFNSSLEKP